MLTNGVVVEPKSHSLYVGYGGEICGCEGHSKIFSTYGNASISGRSFDALIQEQCRTYLEIPMNQGRRLIMHICYSLGDLAVRTLIQTMIPTLIYLYSIAKDLENLLFSHAILQSRIHHIDDPSA